MLFSNLVMAFERWQLPFFFFLVLVALFATATSQYEVYSCSNSGNYTSESIYRANLNTLLRSLSTRIGNSGFDSSSVGQVKAIAFCRADIQVDTCRGCIGGLADQILGRCPNQMAAIMWSQYCMIRYSNESILFAVDPQSALRSTMNATSPARFMEVVRKLLDDLRSKAANAGPLRKAAAGNETAPSPQTTIFAMVQCTPDLSPENCTSCLARATERISAVRFAPIGMRVYQPSCITRYESAPFYNLTRLQEPLEPSPPAGKKNDNTTRNVVIIVIPVVVSLVIAFFAAIFVRKKAIQKRMKESENVDDEISIVESLQYDFAKIRVATNDFSDAKKLGQGGFGAVYKGKLLNGQEIAVKRLSKNSIQGDVEFKNEVLLVAKLQHKNLVRLLGFSLEGTERLLVYEFVSNGSLDHLIFDSTERSNLDWGRRYKIIVGIAKGLLYLHEDSRLRIIHRDLKTSNVLLDEELNPKISDFGMAKLVVRDETQGSTSRIVGTYGYMAPEYIMQGQFSVKSDVFSFGVLILEIVSGRKTVTLQNGECSEDLPNYAWRNWFEGTASNVVDPILRDSSTAQQDILRCIHIGLLCVQENVVDRPTMATIVLMFNSLTLSLPMPSKPAFFAPSFPETSLPRGFSDTSRLQEYNSREMKCSSSSKYLVE